MRRALRIAGYVAWFVAAFVVGVYLTFPLDEAKGAIVELLETQLGKGKQGQHGVDPVVRMGKLSVSGFGVSAKQVSIQLPNRNPDPGPTIDIDELAIGVRPWTLLSDAKTVVIDADVYGGTLAAVVSADAKGVVRDADIELDDLDLAKIPLAAERLGMPLTGTVELDVELDLGDTPEKDGEGKVRVVVKDAAMGPGNLKALIPLLDLEVPLIDLGKLEVDIPVKQGKGTITGAKVDGKDMQLELFGDLFVRGKLQQSRIDLDGYFQPTASFLEREKKVRDLLELGEKVGGTMGLPLPRAKDEEGRYYFSLKGSIEAPQANLARDNGRRAKQRSQKGAAATPSPPVLPERGDPKERPSRSPMSGPLPSTKPPAPATATPAPPPPPPPAPDKADEAPPPEKSDEGAEKSDKPEGAGEKGDKPEAAEAAEG
ncbi:MAG: type II secretion system protein GspN [Deltaproteobacteria bacterium]|nr:type II secretion system protein GspN [Deltaproteobacteria bacterium]